MSTLTISIVLVMLALLASCDSRDSEKNPCELDTQVRPIKLLADELSYSHVENYANLYSDSSFHWIERVTYPDHGGLSVDRFEVRREFLGQMGKLEYVFYFRRLAEMRFQPDNTADFFRAARSKGLPASHLARLAAGDLEYWVMRVRDDVEYFGVADRRITRTANACTYAFD